MLLKWIYENREKDGFEMLLPGMDDLTKVLASPLLNIWIELDPIKMENPYFRGC